jgi:hypothetical protein
VEQFFSEELVSLEALQTFFWEALVFSEAVRAFFWGGSVYDCNDGDGGSCCRLSQSKHLL